MSFSAEVKTELCKVKTPSCCRMAECYGMLLFGRAFSQQEIIFQTEIKSVAERLISNLKYLFRINPILTLSGLKKSNYTVRIHNPEECKLVFEKLGYTDFINQNGIMPIDAPIQKECCSVAFIRGAFLSCGTVVDPNKEYHAEFFVRQSELAEFLKQRLIENGLNPSEFVRQGGYVLYFKGSEFIEDLLATIKASNFMLQLAEIKVFKDYRNHYNRVANCEAANIGKTVNAAVAQCEAIRQLEKSGQLKKLPQELKEAAKLRLDHPEDSLATLCTYSKQPITKSGLNHRLKKLVALAQDQN